MKDEVLTFEDTTGTLMVKPSNIKAAIIKESPVIVNKYDVFITIDTENWVCIANNLTKEFAYETAKNLLEKGEMNYY